MLGRSVNVLHRTFKRCFHTSLKKSEKFENPISRTFRILGNDIKSKLFINSDESEVVTIDNEFPRHTDVVIIGGGAVGSSIAYWLKEKSGNNGIDVVVLEKQPTYQENSSVLSVGGLRQQFSLPENIQMSLFGAEFLRTLEKRFGPGVDVYFQPYGYLVLASERGAQQLLDNAKLQKELGAVNTVLGKEALKDRFPWLDVTEVELGCLGLEKEGWFDPWALLNTIRQGAIHLGARYITGEAVEFTFRERQDIIVEGIIEGTYEGLDELIVQLPSGERQCMKFAICIIAAGAESGSVAKMCKIGEGPGMLSIPLPVERRKRYVYRFNCQGEGPGLNTPMTIDFTGAYFRREGLGGSYIAGISPLPDEEPRTNNLDVDYQFFDNKLWPVLATRVPAFNAIKVKSGWSGFYDFNMYDENGIIGPHPYYHNLYIATGFSGHGIQQSPAVGRAIAELVLDGGFQTIDLTRLGFDRLVVDKPMQEVYIV